VNEDERLSLLDNLRLLLEKQIEMARIGDFHAVEDLVEQAGSIIDEISKTNCHQRPQFISQREHITGLYKKLELMLASTKDSISKQLSQAGNVLKTLDVYRNKG
jgi:hypothetical protein